MGRYVCWCEREGSERAEVFELRRAHDWRHARRATQAEAKLPRTYAAARAQGKAAAHSLARRAPRHPFAPLGWRRWCQQARGRAPPPTRTTPRSRRCGAARAPRPPSCPACGSVGCRRLAARAPPAAAATRARRRRRTRPARRRRRAAWCGTTGAVRQSVQAAKQAYPRHASAPGLQRPLTVCATSWAASKSCTRASGESTTTPHCPACSCAPAKLHMME